MFLWRSIATRPTRELRLPALTPAFCCVALGAGTLQIRRVVIVAACDVIYFGALASATLVAQAAFWVTLKNVSADAMPITRQAVTAIRCVPCHA